MGRMTKYLRQKAQLQLVVRNEAGEAQMDEYGKYKLEETVEIKCRKEPTHRITVSSTGMYTQCSHRYFTDETHVIQVGDVLDGHRVLEAHQYWGNTGQFEGMEVYT